MKIYNLPRRGGKTTAVIKHCQLTGAALWVFSENEKKRLMDLCRRDRIKIDIVTTNDILQGKLKGKPHPTHLAADNVDMILEHISGGYITAMTSNGEEKK